MTAARNNVAVGFDAPRHRTTAEALCQQLGLPLAKKFGDPHPLLLAVTDHHAPGTPTDDAAGARLELRVVERGHALAGGHGVYADLTHLDTTSPAGRSLKTPLLKAVGIKRGQTYRPRVLDTTAGLGEDTWLLAAAGCAVTAIERQPIVHALLADALARASVLRPDVTDRITLAARNDAAAFLSAPPANAEFDVVLIDPMFPGSDKRKTTERKAMRVLRWLAGDDADADKLLDLSIKTARRRVVVKRPRRAPDLAGRSPAVVHAGRGFRFDLYPITG